MEITPKAHLQRAGDDGNPVERRIGKWTTEGEAKGWLSAEYLRRVPPLRARNVLAFRKSGSVGCSRTSKEVPQIFLDLSLKKFKDRFFYFRASYFASLMRQK